MNVFKLLRLFSIICLFSKQLFSQGEDNIWYFGFSAGVDFNFSPPTALTNANINSNEGCASVCNKNGEILFYSNGETIWNTVYDTMQNGGGLLGHTSTSQGVIIVPKPRDPDIYYVFTNSSDNTIPVINKDSTLRYSIVDMSLDGGLGAVTLKNIPLLTRPSEQLTAVRHANGEDIWVVSCKLFTNSFYAYLITKDGIDLNPVISNTGVIRDGNNYQGYIKSSPKGNKLGVTLGPSLIGSPTNIQLFDFDNHCGIVSNPIDFLSTQPRYTYGLEFSPDGTKLYTSHSGTPPVGPNTYGIYQFNLEAGGGNPDSIINSGILLPTPHDPAGLWEVRGLQLGPNDKIYVNTNTLKGYISAIENPNELGFASNYNDSAIYLNGGKSSIGFPQKVLVRDSFNNFQILLTDSCQDSLIFIYVNKYLPDVTYQWKIDNIILPDDSSEIFYVFNDTGMHEIQVSIKLDSICVHSSGKQDSASIFVNIIICDSTIIIDTMTIDTTAILPINPDTFFMPSAISPNGDNINDFVDLIVNNKLKTVLKLYNRYGEIIYDSSKMIDFQIINDLPNGTVLIYYLEVVSNNITSHQKGNLTIVK